MIYFDNAATTPVSPAVQRVIAGALADEWGNPSSLHSKGFAAEKAMRKARADIARSLGVGPASLVFTSGASESINTAMRSMLDGVLQRRARNLESGAGKLADAPADGAAVKPANIVMSAVEHSAVFQTGMLMERYGIEVRVCPVDAFGRVNPDDMLAMVDENTVLVALMQINNELGTVEPVEEVGTQLKAKHPDVLFLVDGTQALGKTDVRAAVKVADFYAASGHKIHAPKGIGLLYVRPGLSLHPLITGGPQEGGQRAGTENVAYILGFAEALREMDAARGKEPYAPEIRALHERALARAKEIPGVRVNSPEDGSPYILNLAFSGIRAEVLLHFMEMAEMYVSSGSACNKGKHSRVLDEIRLDSAFQDGAMRISFGRENTLDEVDPFFDRLAASIEQIRSITGA